MCPELVLPKTLDGLPALERLDLSGYNERPLPDWVFNLDLVLDWTDWLRLRAKIPAERVCGLAMGNAGPVANLSLATWPRHPLESVRMWDLSTSDRDKIVGFLLGRSGDTLVDLALYQCGGSVERLAEFQHLRRLGVTQHQSEVFPEYLYRLEVLEALHWGHGGLTTPPRLDSWPCLRHLGLPDNSLTSLPEDVGHLACLEVLNIGANGIRTLPSSLAGHPRLHSLALGGNPLRELPPWLFRLPNLTTLDLTSFERTWPVQWSIPSDILAADHLTHLLAPPRDFVTPPPEVVARGLDAIKTYWRQRTEGDTDYLSEAKLLIIGEPGAGKTTLARKLRDRDAPPPEDGESTEGIDVHRWGIDGHIRVDGKTTARYIDVNIWDFGGQEIYHATHQFFLSRRSVYVLVTDCRREDTDFHYWLRAAELFGGDSPVVIVLNERHGRTREIDADRWRGRFPALAEVVAADLSTPEGADTVRTAVERQILSLDHLADALPKRWRDVREALEARREGGEAHITLATYLALCAAHGFEARDDKLVLSGYLHDLGVCLHFQDGGLLERTVILDPEWGTDAVYRVLDHRPIVDARGRFTRAQLADVWTEAHYEGMHGELLALMQRFELCYPLPGGTTYIAPQLLGRERPSYRLPAAPGITLRYRYAFMPKGIVTRFIVATHDMQADQGKVWRSGVVLRRGEAWCEVVEDYPAREVTVRVVGDDRAGLLGIVDRELERIHASFERKLRYETLVPCDCDGCARSGEPHLYAYTTLQRFARAGEAVKCEQHFAEVDAARLLDRALPERRARDRDDRSLGAPARARAVEVARAAGEVFVSYAHDCKASRALVERVQARCARDGIAVQRDTDAVRYRESFAPFMQRLGRGRCVIVVLSDAFFHSANCMRELLALAGHPEVAQRVFPLPAEPHTRDPKALGRYLRFWQDERDQFEAMVAELGGEDLGDLRAELDLRVTIRARLARLHGMLAGMNALDAAVHGDGELDGLVDALRAAMA